jgi:type IV pilus assembly protein PilP
MRTALVLIVALAAPAAAQVNPSAPPPARQAPASVQAPAPAPAPTPSPAFVYNPEGRRDPFVSLLRRASEARTRQAKPPAAGGVSGFLVSEITLRGVLQSRADHVALVSGPDGKTYLIKVNDRLLDGLVRAITNDTLICMQDVNDPLSLTKQREVRMTLRAVTEAK